MSVFSRRHFLAMAAGAGGAAALAALGCGTTNKTGAGGAGPARSADPRVADALRSAGLQSAQRSSWALGSEVALIALHAKREQAEGALDAALAELRRIERVMSIYLPDSQLARLNRDGLLADPDPYLVEVLGASADMSQRSASAFDFTVQPLWNLYVAAHAAGKLPGDAAIESARRNVDWRLVDAASDRVRLGRPGAAVTLNGIAQGYAVDRVMAVLRGHGIENALVNTGEIGALGSKASGRPWTAGIRHPRHPEGYIRLADLDGRCMSTSGDYATSFSADLAYNHIFDPATGRSPTAFSSVTVVAPTGTQADAMSTAIFVLGPDKGLKLATATPRTDVFVVLKDGRTLATAGFPGAA